MSRCPTCGRDPEPIRRAQDAYEKRHREKRNAARREARRRAREKKSEKSTG